VQTGGFGSFSKYGGLVAASLLEAEIVTADGQVRIVNACRHPDLFMALKGGGAGFGITARLTLATRPLPDRFGFYGWTLAASSDAAFRGLIEAFCRFANDALINPHWGEQITVKPDNQLEFAMVFQGLTDDAVRQIWKPFQDWVAGNAEVKASNLRLISIPARGWWDFDYRKQHLPDSIIIDERPSAAPGRFWWSGNAGEVGIFLSGYESAWLPERLLDGRNRKRLVDALFAASRHHAVGLHFNKGLAGADPARRAEARATSIHPGAIDAFALAIIAGGQKHTYPGVLGHEPDLAQARAEAKKIAAAMATLRRVAPDSGSYSSEMSFFAKDWRRDAWGPHYNRLLATKKKYDPDGLFTGHHQVGSEFWSTDGFTRMR
jgi:FAD/FMN-containing dehydrogenase